MQSIPPLFGRANRNISCLRSLATAAAAPGGESRSSKIILERTVRLMQKNSEYPGWNAISMIKSYHKESSALELLPLLKKCGIPLAEYRTWGHVLYSANLDSATAYFDAKVLKADEDNDMVYTSSSLTADDRPPTWLIIYLLYRKIRSQTHAHQACSMVIAHLPYTPPEMRPSLLILAACVLGSHRVWQPLERVVSIFIGLPLYEEAWHFNLFLQCMSRIAVSKQSGHYLGRLTMNLLDAMRTRQLTLTSSTYLALLTNRFITIELTDALRVRMASEGFTPTRTHLEAYVKIFASRGAIHSASSYDKAIRKLIPPQHPQDDVSKDTPPIDEASHSLDLVAYLQNLLERPVVHSRTDGNMASEQRQKLVKPRSVLRNLRGVTTTARWTNLLARLARSNALSSRDLYDAFQFVRENRPPRAAESFEAVTPMTYSIFITGLLRRGDFELARQAWDEYESSDLPLDRRSVGVGMDVLTKTGSPDKALALLEKEFKMSKLDANLIRTRLSVIEEESQRLDISILNAFMTSLCHVERPDIVFYLWDKMELLWGARPDGTTLSILLNASRLASQLFASFTGAFHELGLSNPFRSAHKRSPALAEPQSDTPVSQKAARRAALTGLSRLLESDVKVNEMWGTTVAWRRARDLFRYILFSHFPQLSTIESPARALRESADDIATSPFHEMKRLFRRPTVVTPPDILLKKGLHPVVVYPEVVFTDRAFCSYIILLGSRRLASEIPLALAWMRELEILPRKKTLAFALVYWGEVSMDAPLFEQWGSASGEYAKLVLWMRDWVGMDGVPTPDDLRQALRRIDKLRRGVREEDLEELEEESQRS
ncbi:hypothetical protein EVG20_g2235 [Dentipellis fragilis]|uniref:Pentacotripeptide-repeat region of PRORP domain-containing protein n=1 Tax=Dentipellis fragilis TaxID=205917 RepID=A0A4Y9Z7D4_9AGAM|nr:hypothetical protein EVG20_g2235 [Dentipellis fragilis]